MDSEETLQFKPEADLDEIVATYLKSAQAGAAPPQEELLARSGFAKELAEFFADQERFQRVAEPIRAAVTGTPPIGTRIRYFGDYELLEEIGRGGMGVVYKAKQVSLNRTVALKMILTGELANEADVRRFQAEAEAAAKLDHPSIVPIFEVGQHQGHHYFSMAFIESDSLAHKIAQGLPAPRQAAELLRNVAEAVAYAHVEGVIHRDLKPANILIDRNGQPRLTDFGLAKRFQSEPDATAAAGLTATGQVLGTPSYMPPEQASGQRGAVGPQADIYSLGAILYCLLTGRPPFQAANPLDTLLQVLDSEPVPPRQLNAAAPRDLETICLKCLNKEPRKRYGSAQDLVRDLERYLGGQPIHARPTGTGERLGKWVKRRPAAAASLFLAFVIAIGLPLLLAALLHNAQERAQAVQDLTVAANDLSLAQQNTANQEGLAKQAQANLNLATTDLISVRGEADQQKQLVKEALYNARGLRLIGQSSALRVNNPGLALLLAIEGQKLAPGPMANNALREAIDECHEERTIPVGNAFGSAFYSPDGKMILSMPGPSNFGDMPVRLWDSATGAHLADLAVPPISLASATFSPDSKRVVFTFESNNRMIWHNKPPEIIYTDCVVRVWDIATRKEIAILKGHKSRVASVHFGPDGKKLVTASWDGTVRIWDTATWTDDRVIAAHEASAARALFSPDGRSILTGTTSVRHWRASDEELLKIKNALIDPPAWTLPPGVKPGDQPSSQSYMGADFSLPMNEKIPAGIPEGIWTSHDMAISPAMKQENAIVIWDAATGKKGAALKHGPKGMQQPRGSFFPLAWAPKGDQVLTWSSGVSNGITCWDAATGEARVNLPTGLLAHVLFNPDGTRVLTVPQDGSRLSLWDAVTGKEVLVIPVSASVAGTPSFSPNGRWILCACGDKAARIWSADTGAELWCFRGHQMGFTSAAFSPEGTRVVTVAPDGTLRIWNPQRGRDYARVLQGSLDMYQVVFSPDGRHVATASDDARLWDAHSGKLLHRLHGLTSLGDSPARDQILGEALSLEFSVDGRRLLVASRETPARILKPTLFGFGREIEEQVPFTPVRLWDVETGKGVVEFRGARAEVGRAAFSPNGKLVLAAESGLQNLNSFSLNGTQRGSSGGTIAKGQAYIWDATTGKLVQTLQGHLQGIRWVAWSPDSKRVLTADMSNGFKNGDGAARIWDVQSGKPVVKLDGDRGQVRLATFSPDGTHVLMLQFPTPYSVEIWDASNGRVAFTLGGPNRNSRVVLVAAEGETPPGHTGTILHAAYSPDGRRIVTTSEDKTARIWDAATGKELFVLRGHILGVRSAAFCADGKLVVTASEDETARIWDAQTGAEVITLAGHKGPVLTAAFSPDGKRVATGSSDGTVRLWPIDPVPLAVSRKPRELSAEERERFGLATASGMAAPLQEIR